MDVNIDLYSLYGPFVDIVAFTGMVLSQRSGIYEQRFGERQEYGVSRRQFYADRSTVRPVRRLEFTGRRSLRDKSGR